MKSHLNDYSDSQIDDTTSKQLYSHHISMPGSQICDVWAHNFDQEMKRLMELSEHFKVVAMDTEFPGMFALKNCLQMNTSTEDAQYSYICKNIEQTKLIQVGLTIADESGKVPSPICTWQFNFKFDISQDNIVPKSADLLKSSGINFNRLKNEGIEHEDFAEYLEASGLIYKRDVKWVVFHGSSDFAYLLRLLKNTSLPTTITQFYSEMNKFFPVLIDLKYALTYVPDYNGIGLTKLSKELGCQRIGHQHQAGSDSLLTLCCFFRMNGLKILYNCGLMNTLYGIGNSYVPKDKKIFKKRERGPAYQINQGLTYQTNYNQGHYYNQTIYNQKYHHKRSNNHRNFQGQYSQTIYNNSVYSQGYYNDDQHSYNNQYSNPYSQFDHAYNNLNTQVSYNQGHYIQGDQYCSHHYYNMPEDIQQEQYQRMYSNGYSNQTNQIGYNSYEYPTCYENYQSDYKQQ